MPRPCTNCCKGPPDPTCDAPAPQTITSCDDIIGVMNVNDCFRAMPYVVTLEFQDSGGCNWSILNGSYFFRSYYDIRETGGDQPACILWDKRYSELTCEGASGIDLNHSLYDCCPAVSAGCNIDPETFLPFLQAAISQASSNTDDNGGFFCNFVSSFRIDLPTDIESGITFTFDPSTAECDGGVNEGDPDAMCNNFIGGNVVYLGAPCDDPESDCNTNAVDVSFALTQLAGCVWQISEVLVNGVCVNDEDYECYWSDGQVGCNRVSLVGYGGCGEQSGAELTLHVVDKRGCVGSHTEELPPCCNCEDADGVHCSSPGLTILAAHRVDENGDMISFLECPSTGEEGVANCAGTDKKWTCRWKFVVDYDDTDNCGNSWYMTVQFTQGGSASNGMEYHTKEFYIDDVSEGWAPNICLVFKFTSVTSPPEVSPPFGCDAESFNGAPGGWVYATSLVPASPFYPGNYNWGCHTPSYPDNCWPTGDPVPCYYSTACDVIYPGSTPPCEIPEECGGA